MKGVGDILKKNIPVLQPAAPERNRGPRNERDELFDYFYENLKGPWLAFAKRPLRKAHLAVKISHLKKQDLYYLKSVCEDAQRRGVPFSKAFWGALKVKYPQDKIPFERSGV